MDFQRFSQQLSARHPSEPQKRARLEMACRQAREALEEFTRQGYVYHLAEGPGPELPEWPRQMFHVDAAPNGRLVHSEFELAELGPGWFSTLEQAQHWDGVATQFAGRGGIPRKGLPAVLQPLGLEEILSLAAEAQEAKLQRIAEFRAAQNKEP